MSLPDTKTILHFLGKGDMAEARSLCLRSDPAQLQALYPHVLALATQHQSSRDPEAVGLAIRVRELALEWDPSDAANLVQLVLLGLRTGDEWRVYLHAQALVEVWESWASAQDPLPQALWGIQANSFFQVLLSGLGLGGYWDVFFGLGAAYIPALPAEQRDPARAVLAQLAIYYAPDGDTQDTSPQWHPRDLLHWIVPEILKLLFHGSSLRGYSIMAEQMQRLALAPETAADPELELRLLADALDYCCLSGIPTQAQDLLDKILQLWPLERVETLAQQPQPGSLVLLWTILFRVCFDWAYLSDDQAQIRRYQQAAGAGLSRWLRQMMPQGVTPATHQLPTVGSRPLRVGYLGLCFRRHSVGTLSFEALTQHNRERVQSYYYFVGTLDQPEDPIYAAFKTGSHRFYDLAHQDWPQVLAQVQADDLDILVYLDATTSDLGCKVLAMRPAPIQISWLGGDSPGLPEIDYFWVDPHILAADAQSDYTETLLRLPTFAAVGEFPVAEIDLGALRAQWGIPTEALVYWTSAHARKRSDECIEAHLAIVAAVPDSVLVIKGVGDISSLAEAYRSRAERLGITSQLRFVPMTHHNEEHRAQLQLADLILDTFPYTGATHTFEALYLGIPVLTRVGRHYYGRMSYTLLQTLGLRDCITWDRQEYIRQGIHLGHHRSQLAQLQQTIRASRQDPGCVLWDPIGFVRHLEDVYEQLVEKHQTGERNA
ncbi:MAG: hypothetical protein ACFCU9_09780 [Cyanophyceae cyanobacterium]